MFESVWPWSYADTDAFATDRSENQINTWRGVPDLRRTVTEGVPLNVGLVEAANKRFLIEHPLAVT